MHLRFITRPVQIVRRFPSISSAQRPRVAEEKHRAHAGHRNKRHDGAQSVRNQDAGPNEHLVRHPAWAKQLKYSLKLRGTE